jgi:hypothetical protein
VGIGVILTGGEHVVVQTTDPNSLIKSGLPET